MLNYKKAKILIKSYPIITFLFSIISIALIAYTQKYSTFWGDDLEYSIYFYKENIFDCFSSQIHGCYYIGYFLSKFLSYKLPLLLEIHPSDFICNQLGIIKGLLTVITIFSISNIVKLFNKNRIMYTLIFILTIFYFIYSFYISNSLVPYISYNFFRYFFSFLFLSIFLIYTYKENFFPNKSFRFKNLIFASICGFILGTSIEITFFTLITMFVLTLAYAWIFRSNKNFSLKLTSSFYIPNIFLIFGTIMFTATTGFHEVASMRGMSSININFNILKDFIPVYFKYCFQDEFYYWLVFLILIFITYKFAIKRKETQKVNIIIIYLISLLIVMFSLILCSKTCTMAGNGDFTPTYFIKHTNIIFLYKMLLLIPFIMLVGYLSRISTNAKKKTYLLLTAIIFVFGMFFIFNKNISEYFVQNTNFYQIKQKEMYIVEKMLRFYLLKDEQPIIYSTNDQLFAFNKNQLCMYEQNNLSEYYSGIYKDYKLFKTGYCRSNNAIEDFYQNGGSFGIDELNNINFKNLANDNFVLNQNQEQKEILTPNDVLYELKLNKN